MSTSVSAQEAKLAQAVYITMSQACGCILDRCQASDWVVEKTFVGEKKALLKRLDYAIDRESAKEYIKKYRIPYRRRCCFWTKTAISFGASMAN